MVLFSLNQTILIKKENRTEKVRGNGEGGRMGGWEDGRKVREEDSEGGWEEGEGGRR